MTTCTFPNLTSIWIQPVLLSILISTIQQSTKVRSQQSSHGEPFPQTKRKMKKSQDLICSLAKRRLKRKLSQKTKITMIVLKKVQIVMTHMMRQNFKKREKSIKRKLSLLFKENTKEYVRLLMVIQCYFKMKYSQSNHLKVKSGPILK